MGRHTATASCLATRSRGTYSCHSTAYCLAQSPPPPLPPCLQPVSAYGWIGSGTSGVRRWELRFQVLARQSRPLAASPALGSMRLSPRSFSPSNLGLDYFFGVSRRPRFPLPAHSIFSTVRILLLWAGWWDCTSPRSPTLPTSSGPKHGRAILRTENNF